MESLTSYPDALAVELAYRRALLTGNGVGRFRARVRRRPAVRWIYGRHPSGGA